MQVREIAVLLTVCMQKFLLSHRKSRNLQFFLQTRKIAELADFQCRICLCQMRIFGASNYRMISVPSCYLTMSLWNAFSICLFFKPFHYGMLSVAACYLTFSLWNAFSSCMLPFSLWNPFSICLLFNFLTMECFQYLPVI